MSHTLNRRGKNTKQKLKIQIHSKLLNSPEAWQTQQILCVVRLLQLPPRASQSHEAANTKEGRGAVEHFKSHPCTR